MTRAFATRLKGGMRTVASVVVAAALVMPAFPLSQLAPAYADTADAAYADAADAAGQQATAADQQATAADAIDQQSPSAGSSPQVASEISTAHPGQIYAELALDGSTVDAYGNVTSGGDILSSTESMDLASLPKTDEEKQAILDSYLADGTITEEDLNDEFITESLTGGYMEADQDDRPRNARTSKKASKTPCAQTKSARQKPSAKQPRRQHRARPSPRKK